MPARRRRVEVRRIREGLELRVDGTQASLHRSGRSITGVVWWALAGAVLLAPRHRPRRVLLLGLGAGSVARALHTLDPDAHIVGVEIDGDVLRLARRHFALDHQGVEVVQADALDHLRHEKRRFDLVIEDLFVGPSRSIGKPHGLLDEGYPLIRRRLLPGGYVVSNTLHEMPAVVRALGHFGAPIVSLDVRDYWNRIVICGRDLPPPIELRRLLGARPETARLLPRLSIRTRRARS